MAITVWDDYLIHQTGETLDKVATDNSHFMDRFLFFCHNPEGSLNMLAGLGSYPNANIMDGFMCIRQLGVQRNIRVSRHLEGDRARTQLGVLSFEVVEPLKRWRLHLAENDYGISADLEFEARGKPLMWPVFGIKEMAQTHYDQAGRYKGYIQIEKEKIRVDGFPGGRDRSWGVRRPGMFQMFDVYFWVFAHFSDCTLSVMHLDLLDGNSIMRRGAIERDDGTMVPIVDVRHRILINPEHRSVKEVELLITDEDGENRRVIVRNKSSLFRMSGAGYDDRHGLDKGAYHVEGERWEGLQGAHSAFPFSHYYQQFTDVELDGQKGVGMFEYLMGAAQDWQYKPSL